MLRLRLRIDEHSPSGYFSDLASDPPCHVDATQEAIIVDTAVQVLAGIFVVSTDV